MPKLHIFCDGGFGNRFNILLSGLALAQTFDLPATVYWPRNNWCQASFGDIFTNAFDISEQSLSDLAGTLDKAVVLLHDELGSATLRVPFQSAYAFESAADFAAKVLRTEKDIFFYPALIPPWLPGPAFVAAMRSCAFQPSIVDAVTGFIQHSLGRPFHGLHLRRTDLNVGYTDSEVQEIVRAYPQETFFVCSDDPQAEALASVHPNVQRRPKDAYVGKRNQEGDWNALTHDDDGRPYHSNIDRNAESVVAAVVDMLILAHSAIVGFSGSTFQNIARLLGVHAPLLSIAKPEAAIDFPSLNMLTRSLQNGSLALGECVEKGRQLFDVGRTQAAIEFEKLCLEKAASDGVRDLNAFVLHYNLGTHLVQTGLPYEAALYLEKALQLHPGQPQAQSLLDLARRRAGLPPDPAGAAPAATPMTVNGRGTVTTYLQWHLGDNLIHLHFLRKLAQKYPELQFEHALNPQYLAQCQEVVEDLPQIKLLALVPGEVPRGMDAWKGAEGFFFAHPDKLNFGKLYVALFHKMAAQMGLESPIATPDDLLFDYPAIVRKRQFPRYDVLLINSKPLSEQFKSYNEQDFEALAHDLQARDLRIITTQKIKGFDCTLDQNMSVTDIAHVSVTARYLIAVCTGAMWPSINIYNQGAQQIKIILNDHEVVAIGKNIQMCTDSSNLRSLVLDQLRAS